MASPIVTHNCPICKDDILPGEPYRVIGVDQSRAGEPPVSIYAHKLCVDARGFRGCVVIGPGEAVGRIVERPAGGQMALAW